MLRQLRNGRYQRCGAVLFRWLAAAQYAGDGEAGEAIGASGGLVAIAARVAVVAVGANGGRRCCHCGRSRRGAGAIVVNCLAVVVVVVQVLGELLTGAAIAVALQLWCLGRHGSQGGR